MHTFSFGYHSADFYAEIWKKVKLSGVWQGEVMNRRKNGELYSEYLTIASVKDCNEEITHYVATVNDITEYKESASYCTLFGS